MKLLNDIIKKALDRSASMQDMLETVTQVAAMAQNMAKNMLDLARQQQIHHQMIAQLWANQQMIAKRMADGAVDLSLPRFNDAEDVPNKDVNKPN